jgi:hypothetical protein
MSVVDFKDVTSRGSFDVDAKAHSLLDDANFIRGNHQTAEFRFDSQRPLLRNW